MKTILITVFMTGILVNVHGMYINKKIHHLTNDLNQQLSTREILNEKLRSLRDVLLARSVSLDIFPDEEIKRITPKSTKKIVIDPASKIVELKSDGKHSIFVKKGNSKSLQLRIRHKPGKRINLVINSKKNKNGKRQRVLVSTTGGASLRLMKKKGKFIIQSRSNRLPSSSFTQNTYASINQENRPISSIPESTINDAIPFTAPFFVPTTQSPRSLVHSILQTHKIPVNTAPSVLQTHKIPVNTAPSVLQTKKISVNTAQSVLHTNKILVNTAPSVVQTNKIQIKTASNHMTNQIAVNTTPSVVPTMTPRTTTNPEDMEAEEPDFPFLFW